MDLNKEIKLSDLFRRTKGPAEEDASNAEKPEKEKKERKSFSFSRTREPKEPKQPKAPKEGAKAAPKKAPAPPAVPLMRAFDLMPKESEREKTSASPAFLKVVVALVAVLVLAGIAGAYMMMGARAKDRQARVDDLRAQLAEIEAEAAEGQGPNTAALTAEGQARTAALSQALAARVAWDRILREFSLVLPEDVWLTTLSSSSPAAGAVPDPAAAAAGGEATFTIVGFATSQEAVATLLSRLEVVPEFASVQLQSSARGGGEAEGGASADPQDFSFSIVATIAPNGVPAQ
ncbi:MAG TPA: PilN domain-containing protein [Gaiellaceae bacterium]|nr:PilN domain-containing protein [Gaiellaceae bacterium]